MKKYKLIQEYPGSPPVGTEVLANHFGNSLYQGVQLYSVNSSPKFWKEVVQKEYEVLSYMGNVTLTLYTLTKEGDYKNSALAHTFMPEIFETDSYKIHSVKRLSDGEVFTVGDSIITDTFKTKDKYIITQLLTEDSTIAVIGKNFSVTLPHVKHVKKPLFTTMDGVEIFEGDKIWRINGLWHVLDHISADNLHAKWSEDWFSSKKAAEEYILMNKPCMSVNDIISQTEDAMSRTQGKLRSIAKSKL